MRLVCWYTSDDCWNKADTPDYWRKITLLMRNECEKLKNDISDWKLEKEFAEND